MQAGSGQDAVNVMENVCFSSRTACLLFAFTDHDLFNLLANMVFVTVLPHVFPSDWSWNSALNLIARYDELFIHKKTENPNPGVLSIYFQSLCHSKVLERDFH